MVAFTIMGSSGVFRFGLIDQFDFNVDLDLITNEKASGFQGLIPFQAKILAVDGCRGGEIGTHRSLGAFGLSCVFYVQGYFLGGIPDGQIAN
jgi:hypothetical protein